VSSCPVRVAVIVDLESERVLQEVPWLLIVQPGYHGGSLGDIDHA
jgi:hypothetical protein